MRAIFVYSLNVNFKFLLWIILENGWTCFSITTTTFCPFPIDGTWALITTRFRSLAARNEPHWNKRLDWWQIPSKMIIYVYWDLSKHRRFFLIYCSGPLRASPVSFLNVLETFYFLASKSWEMLNDQFLLELWEKLCLHEPENIHIFLLWVLTICSTFAIYFYNLSE